MPHLWIKILMVISGLLLSQSAWAATFTVNTTTIGTPAADADTSAGDGTCLNGAGFCSFRAAVQEANALAGADTIELVHGAIYDATCGGCTDGTDQFQALPRITTDLTINGNTSTITNTGNNRFVTITAGTVVINNLTFSNGAPGDPGDGGARAGAMNVAGGTLTLNTCTLSGNVGSGVDTGGAIYLNGGTLNINSSTFTANGGPAIRHYFGGTLNITGSTFREPGGALWTSLGGPDTISNTLVESSGATAVGGAVAAGGSSTVTISNSIFKDNTGPALFAWGATYVSVSNTTFKGTTGVALSTNFADTTSVDVIRSAFINNTGGGIALAGLAGTSMTVANSTFSGNTATGGKGGAILATSGTLNLKNTTISQNTSSGSGGGVYKEAAATVTVQNSIISGNTATTAGNDCTGAASFTSGGNNIIGDTSGCTGLTSVGSAGLDTLVDQTSTANVSGTAGRAWYPLTSSSAAINAGGVGTCSSTDQLDNARISTCDIGAVEFGQPELSISATDSPDPIDSTKNLTYTITVANLGTDDAANVTLTTNLASGMSLSSATPSQGTCSGTTCTLGTISASSSATITMVIRPTTPGTNQTTFTVSTTSTETGSASNTTTVDTTVNDTSGGTLYVTTSAYNTAHVSDSFLSFGEAVLLINGTLLCTDFSSTELGSSDCDVAPNAISFAIPSSDANCTSGICTLDLSALTTPYTFTSDVSIIGADAIIFDASESTASSLIQLTADGGGVSGLLFLGNDQKGIEVTGDGITLFNLTFRNFSTSISVSNTDNTTLSGIEIGMDDSGLLALPGDIGIDVNGSTDFLISNSYLSAHESYGLSFTNSSNAIICSCRFGTNINGNDHLFGQGYLQNVGLYVDRNSYSINIGPSSCDSNNIFRYNEEDNILVDGYVILGPKNLIAETTSGKKITFNDDSQFECTPEITSLIWERVEKGKKETKLTIKGTTCPNTLVSVYTSQATSDGTNANASFQSSDNSDLPVFTYASETTSSANQKFEITITINLEDDTKNLEVMVYARETVQAPDSTTIQSDTPLANPIQIPTTSLIEYTFGLGGGGCSLASGSIERPTSYAGSLQIIFYLMLLWMSKSVHRPTAFPERFSKAKCRLFRPCEAQNPMKQ